MEAVGSLTLATGMASTLIGVSGDIAAAFLLGTAIAGLGWGAALLDSSFRTVLPPTDPQERAGVSSTLHVVGCLAFSLPARAAGAISTRFGLHRTADGGAGVLILLSVTAVVLTISQRRHPEPQCALPMPPRV